MELQKLDLRNDFRTTLLCRLWMCDVRHDFRMSALKSVPDEYVFQVLIGKGIAACASPNYMQHPVISVKKSAYVTKL